MLVTEKKSWPESTDENVVQSETVVEISGLSQGGHNRKKRMIQLWIEVEDVHLANLRGHCVTR